MERSPRAARRALSSLCQAAARRGAIRLNPVRDIRPIACPCKRVRALTISESIDLLGQLRSDPAAVKLDLPDFVEFILGTGMQIGEAAAVRVAVLDLDAATVHVNATLSGSRVRRCADPAADQDRGPANCLDSGSCGSSVRSMSSPTCRTSATR